MKIAVANDHAGFDLREAVFEAIRGSGHEAVDLGTRTKDSVDYPDFAASAARGVAAGEYDFAVLICGTGQGMAMTANKVRGVRAAVCGDTFSARMAREHNDANILCLGSRVLGPGLAGDIVRAFLAGAFAGGRHAARVEKIRLVESEEGRS